MFTGAQKSIFQECTKLFGLLALSLAGLLTLGADGFVSNSWEFLPQERGQLRSLEMQSSRQLLFNVSGKGMFEGGPRVLGDSRRTLAKLWEVIRSLRVVTLSDLKGIPLTSAQPRKRGTSEQLRPSALVSGARNFASRETGRRGEQGFTLIELVMVVLLLSVLAAVAIPNFNDFRSDARDAAARGALGGIRSALAIARAAIALKEDSSVPAYPTAIEMQANTYAGSHPILNALATLNKRILDPAVGMPINPWSVTTIPSSSQSSVWDCSALTKNLVRSGTEQAIGWCYNTTTGEIWANSARNGQASPNTENKF